jgi:probable phosphoglycerate mutase
VRVLAIRHGETDWNVSARIQGQLDIPLNRHGHVQGQRLRVALSHEPITALYASDLMRAIETADYLAQNKGLSIQADASLRERRFGVFQGLTVEEILARWPEEGQRWRRRDPDFAPEGGETLTQFSQRCIQAVLRIAARHSGQTIALVAHGGVLDCLYRAATHVDLQAPRTWALPNTGINRLLCHEEGLTLIGWADASHLDELGIDEAT